MRWETAAVAPHDAPDLFEPRGAVRVGDSGAPRRRCHSQPQHHRDGGRCRHVAESGTSHDERRVSLSARCGQATTSTSHGASCTTRSATGPSSVRATKSRPRRPTMIRSAATSRATSMSTTAGSPIAERPLNRRVLSRRQELARFREEQVRIHCSTDQLGAEPRGTHLRRDGDDHDRWPLDGELTDTLHPSPRAFRAVVPEHDGEGLAGVAHVNALDRARRSPNESALVSAPLPLRLSRSEPVRPEYVHPREHATRLALVDSDISRALPLAVSPSFGIPHGGRDDRKLLSTDVSRDSHRYALDNEVDRRVVHRLRRRPADLYLEASTAQILLQSGSEVGVGAPAVVDDDARRSNVASHPGSQRNDATPDTHVDDLAIGVRSFAAPTVAPASPYPARCRF